MNTYFIRNEHFTIHCISFSKKSITNEFTHNERMSEHNNLKQVLEVVINLFK